ncbi:hypothetical protein [Burkholderia phage BCSR5]|nr:hypothetical protein [Burkholderia phage BCSR5]
MYQIDPRPMKPHDVVIQHGLQLLLERFAKIPEGMSRDVYGSSVVVYNKKRTINVKVQADGHLFVDRKVKGQWKSHKEKCDSVDEACDKAFEFLN